MHATRVSSRAVLAQRRTFLQRSCPLWLLVILLIAIPTEGPLSEANDDAVEVLSHITSIATLARASPMVSIAAGWFLMGTVRKDDDPYGLETQFDNTEYPQRRIWMDAYRIDRDEVSLSEYLAFLRDRGEESPEELTRLLQHLIKVHSVPDYAMAPWPALYVTWQEAADFCGAQTKRLPTEAEWEKAARGTQGALFPWGAAAPTPERAVFGRYHVHEIPLVAAVNSGGEGESPYGARHMAGNVGEWIADWFGFDYYPIMPERNPPGPATGRYKGVRGGSWRSHPAMLRAATRNGAVPDRRSATIGFRCARSVS